MKKTRMHSRKALMMPIRKHFSLAFRVMCGSSSSIPSADMYQFKNLLLRALGDMDIGRTPYALVLTSLHTIAESRSQVMIVWTKIVTAASPARVLWLTFQSQTKCLLCLPVQTWSNNLAFCDHRDTKLYCGRADRKWIGCLSISRLTCTCLWLWQS